MAFSVSAPILHFHYFSLNKRNLTRSMIRSSLLDDSNVLFQAAKHTVDSYVENGMVIGLGCGRASGFAIEYLGRQLRSGAIKDIVGIPTSIGSASEAAKAGVPLDQYRDTSNIDLAFNDADAMEEETLAAIIGRQTVQGGESSLVQEKTVLRAAGKLVLIVTGRQYRLTVEGSIPILINPANWLDTAEEIDDLFLGDAEVWRRPTIGYAGPSGGDFPLITKEGHNVLDLIFTSPILSLAEVANSLDQVNGVVEHGIISRIPCTAVIATEDSLRFVDNKIMAEGRRA